MGDAPNQAIRRWFQQKEISHHAIYYHYRKWRKDGSLEKVWQGSIVTIEGDLNLSELNLVGTHAIAKKGGEAVAFKDAREPKQPTSYLSQMVMVSLWHRQVY